MDMLPAVIVWLVSVVCGFLIGQNRDQVVSGIVWTALLGPLGLIIVLCLPNKKLREQESEKRLLLEQQLYFQRKQLELAQNNRGARPEPPGKASSIVVAKEGQELGEMKLAVVQTMLQNGQLSMSDYYFDSSANDWLTLDCHPSLVQ